VGFDPKRHTLGVYTLFSGTVPLFMCYETSVTCVECSGNTAVSWLCFRPR